MDILEMILKVIYTEKFEFLALANVDLEKYFYVQM